MRQKRIISLLPSCTEIACALDAAGQLVGRSHECDFPPQVRDLPVCTAPKLDVHAASGEIDRQVKDLLQHAVSIYRIDLEKLKELEPDLILTQAQCEVCAVSLPEVEQAVAKWTGGRPQILSLSPNRLADIWEDIRRVAGALEVSERGRE
ncbi:MAG TPA: cobalamin-binding protein, partial [Verrucomicrobiae bacterium]|nr:cobalamin-binding protein [Verrucomicrobiae bacterium]